MRRAEEGTQIIAQQALDGIEFRLSDGASRIEIAFETLRKVLRRTLRSSHPGMARSERIRHLARSGHDAVVARSGGGAVRLTPAGFAEVLLSG